MPLPAIALIPWLVSLLGSVTVAAFTWFIKQVVYKKAVQYALTTAFIVAAASLTLGIALSFKALILAIRIYMPGPLAQTTYFLPHNLGLIIGVIVTVRVGHALYRWTMKTMALYLYQNTASFH